MTRVAGLEDPIDVRLTRLAEAEVPRRIWEKDFTVWRQEPTEITDRLGWLTVHEAMHDRVPELQEFAAACAADGLDRAVLLAMGGSSLAPEVLLHVFGVAPGMLDLVVLDSTHPEQVLAVDRTLDRDRTLFVVASKSGTTTETLSHLAYFWEKVPDGSRFVAVTDPGTPLDRVARDRGFRRVFLNPPDIGGRYSALSYFGLVPGALLGVDLAALLGRADAMARACARDVPAPENPGVRLGAGMGEAALAGRDKLTLVPPQAIRSFGWWVEQLVAESTGKDGRGIVPVEGEDLGPPEVYGTDRLFVSLGGEPDHPLLGPVEQTGNPVARIPFEDPIQLGAEFFRWEFATAVAGAVLGANPFDQPNVEETKAATRRLLDAGEADHGPVGDLAGLLASVRPGDYLSIQAYLPRNEQTVLRLHLVRMRLRDRLRVATTVGFGPRFLHSTGQLHKGGPGSGVFVQVVELPQEDAPIPGEPYTFGRLLLAQAAGDLQALRARGRRVARVRLEDLEGA